jgi:hypothetical protein
MWAHFSSQATPGVETGHSECHLSLVALPRVTENILTTCPWCFSSLLPRHQDRRQPEPLPQPERVPQLRLEFQHRARRTEPVPVPDARSVWRRPPRCVSPHSSTHSADLLSTYCVPDPGSSSAIVRLDRTGDLPRGGSTANFRRNLV